jgi:hypothetical protein
MLETRGRAAGEGGHNPKGAVDAAQARDRWSHISGVPDAAGHHRRGDPSAPGVSGVGSHDQAGTA